MATQHTFYGRFRVEILTADTASRITIQGSDNADGLYAISRDNAAGFPRVVEGTAWSMSIETTPFLRGSEYTLKDLFLHDTHSPHEGFITVLQTIKPHFPVPGESVTLEYRFRTALRLVYLDEKLKPRPPASPLTFTYDPKLTRVVEFTHDRSGRPSGPRIRPKP